MKTRREADPANLEAALDTLISAAQEAPPRPAAELEDELSTAIGGPVRTVEELPANVDPRHFETTKILAPAAPAAAPEERLRDARGKRRQAVERALKALLREADLVKGRLNAPGEDLTALQDRLGDLTFRALSLAHTRDFLIESPKEGAVPSRIERVRRQRDEQPAPAEAADQAATAKGNEAALAEWKTTMRRTRKQSDPEAGTVLTIRNAGRNAGGDVARDADLDEMIKLKTRVRRLIVSTQRKGGNRRAVARWVQLERDLTQLIGRMRGREFELRAAPEELKIRLEVLEEARLRLEGEREALRAQVTDLLSETETTRLHVERKQGQTRRLQKHTEVLETRLARMQAEIDRAQSAAGAFERERGRLAGETASARDRAADEEFRRLSLESRTGFLEGALAEAWRARHQAVRFPAEHGPAEQELCEVRADLDRRRLVEEQLRGQAAEARARLAYGARVTLWLGSEIDQAERRSARIREEAGRWKDEVRRLQAELHELAGKAEDSRLEREAAVQAAGDASLRQAELELELGEARYAAREAEERGAAQAAELNRRVDQLLEDKARAIVDEQAAIQREARVEHQRIEAQKRLAEARSRLEAVEKDVEAARAEAGALQVRLEETRRNLEETQAENSVLSGRIEATEASLGAAWEERDQAIEDAEHKVENARIEAETRLELIQGENDRLHLAYEQSEAANAGLRGELDEAAAEHDFLRAELEEFQGLGRSFNEQRAELERRIQELSQVRETLLAERNAVLEGRGRAEQELSTARADRAALEEQVTALEEQLEVRIDEADEERREAQEKIEDLRVQLEAGRAEIEARGAEVEARGAELEAGRTEARERERGHRHEKDEMLRAITSYREGELAAQDRARELAAAADREKSARDAAEARIRELEAALAAAREACHEAESRVAARAFEGDPAELLVRENREAFEAIEQGKGISPLDIEPLVAAVVRNVEEYGYRVLQPAAGPDERERRMVQLARVARLAVYLGVRAGYREKDLRGLGLCALLHQSEGLRWFVKNHGHDYARVIRIAQAFETLSCTPRNGALPLPRKVVEGIVTHVSKGTFDKRFVRIFLEALSLFPVGSWVRLNSGETAQVVGANGTDVKRPVVQVVREDGDRRTIDLARTPRYRIEEAVPAPASCA